jgi:hypothetical protein
MPLDKPADRRKNGSRVNERPEEESMRKIKYVKPGVVGGSSVHPC